MPDSVAHVTRRVLRRGEETTRMTRVRLLNGVPSGAFLCRTDAKGRGISGPTVFHALRHGEIFFVPWSPGGFSKRSIRRFHRLPQIQRNSKRLVFPHLRASAQSAVCTSPFLAPLCFGGEYGANRILGEESKCRTQYARRGGQSERLIPSALSATSAVRSSLFFVSSCFGGSILSEDVTST